ncbi:MAG: tetratricopeptide repeat protein [Candidatus Babeliales bacterium]
MKFKKLISALLIVFTNTIFCNSFDTLYQQGLTAQQSMNWDAALESYLQAYALAPERVEPLVMIAQYYIEQKQPELAFMFARRACEQEAPTTSTTLDFQIYDFYRYKALSECASSVREWKLGLWATRQALQVRPQDEQVHERLCYYHEQLVLEAGRAILVNESHE